MTTGLVGSEMCIRDRYFLFSVNVSIYFLNCIKPHHQYSCFSCKQTVVDRCNLLLTFPVYRTTRSHTFITAEVSATGRRSFMDDMTGRFSIGTMHAVFQEVGTAFVEKHALNVKNLSKLFSACLKYSWCKVSGPVALLGFTC